MKKLISLIAGVILLTAVTTSFAKDRVASQRDQATKIEQSIFHASAHATLAGSPYYQEIEAVNEEAAETERFLLAALRTTIDEQDFAGIVIRLENLEVEREVSILRIQARYAHGAGMLDLEMKIRARILHILEEDVGR